MTRSELNRAVAQATGETLRTVVRRGFSMADPDVVAYDPEPYDMEAQIVDWDALDAQRVSLLPA